MGSFPFGLLRKVLVKSAQAPTGLVVLNVFDPELSRARVFPLKAEAPTKRQHQTQGLFSKQGLNNQTVAGTIFSSLSVGSGLWLLGSGALFNAGTSWFPVRLNSTYQSCGSTKVVFPFQIAPKSTGLKALKLQHRLVVLNVFDPELSRARVFPLKAEAPTG